MSVQFTGKNKVPLCTSYIPEQSTLTADHAVQSLVSFPISQGRLVNVVLLKYEPAHRGTTYPAPWVSEATQDELIEVYAGWDLQVTALLKVRAAPKSGWLL